MFLLVSVDVDLTESVRNNLVCIEKEFLALELSRDSNFQSDSFVTFAGNVDGINTDLVTLALRRQIQGIYSRCKAQGQFRISVSD